MNNIQKRFILFIFGCILVRLILVYVAKKISVENLRIMGFIGLIVSISFFIIYLFNLRRTGLEVLGDRIWWNKLRPVHGLLYGLFGYNAIKGNRSSWIYLLIDVLIGIVSFIYHHNSVGNFDKL